MKSYQISTAAAEDLEGIWLYTFKNWSKEQADRYYQLIMDEIEFITKYPDTGTDYSHIRPGYCRRKVKSHLIFYKIDQVSGEINIIRILHQRMDWENRLDD